MHTALDQGSILAIGVAACVFDVRTRRIPNALTFAAAALAVAVRAFEDGPGGAALAAAGSATGALLLFPWFALGGMGAGDVKLMAAFGAWLGPVLTIWSALFAGVIGGVLAIGVACAHGYLGTAWRNVGAMLMYWRTAGIIPVPDLTLQHSTGPRLPYAVPITAGVLVTLWLR